MGEALDFRFADFEIDIARRELRRAGAVVHIEPQVFDLLVHLIRNRDRIVSKDELIEVIWHGRIVSEAALSSRISAARRVLGDSGNDQTLIHTMYKRGFRFVGELDAGVPERVVTSDQDRSAAPADDAVKLVPPAEPLPLPDKPSIAVLPFQNMSRDPEQEYFADGLTEDIITGLSRQRWFFVIARNSSFTYKGEAVDVRNVAAQLGVRYVLEGSVRKADNRVRVTGQLIDAANGNHLWAERYDRELAERSKEATAEHRRMGFGHAGGAAYVAHEHAGAWTGAGIAAAGHCTRCQLRPCARVVGMDLCDHVQLGHPQADR